MLNLIEKKNKLTRAAKIIGRHQTSGENFLFLTGLGLFAFYLIMVHPSTPNFLFETIVFWMATTILILSIAPDYLNHQVIQQWLTKHKDSKLESLYEKAHYAAQTSHKYLNPTIFIAAFILTLTAIAILLFTGDISEAYFGISYGLFMKALLAPAPKTTRQKKIQKCESMHPTDKSSENTVGVKQENQNIPNAYPTTSKE